MKTRLRPYGPVLPLPTQIKAWALGIRDGWAQPYDLSTSTNVDHLRHARKQDPQESQDRGINLGQWLRSPFNHQRPEDVR